jgi:hypothetical protein
MSVAPEIARLALSSRGGDPPGSPRAWGDYPSPRSPLTPVTIGALAGRLRSIASTPERWWGLVRFDPDRSVEIMIEESASHRAWLVVLPPGDAGQGCDCDVATMIAGEATEGAPASAVLRPGPVRVHGQRHGQDHPAHGQDHPAHGQDHPAHGQDHGLRGQDHGLRGQDHGLRGRGSGYSISLHARAHRPARQE